jgi:hypothetical protein
MPGYRSKKKIYPKKRAYAKKKKQVKPKKSVGSLAKKVNTLMKLTQPLYSTRIWDSSYQSDVLSPITIYNMTDFINYQRLFNSPTDQIINVKSIVTKMDLQLHFRPILNTSSNTPVNEPVYFRLFCVSPNFNYRVVDSTSGSNVSSSSPTTVTTTNFISQTHWDCAYNQGAANTNFNPLLNLRCFKLHFFKDYKYYPNQYVLATTTTNATSDPNFGFKTFKSTLRLNHKIDSVNYSWSSISADDVPLSKQIYIIIIAHTAVTGGNSIPFKTQISSRIHVKELQNR